jgi:hypothetical protein
MQGALWERECLLRLHEDEDAVCRRIAYSVCHTSSDPLFLALRQAHHWDRSVNKGIRQVDPRYGPLLTCANTLFQDTKTLGPVLQLLTIARNIVRAPLNV